ncbi:GNAT family N-acetyltransferase [Clostridium beijerinckii]|uniref:GNAT family N-acetyltransferase n=2 Tax=Clostridium beijerinckii TaxID=1520 RepID=UPI001F4C0FB5|nr:GNAT family N-acetyltransferase [Clostridium beijerinckii]NRU38554.1 ribosomal protein S18 acetylase RimI-like enzyme [Clostridium beijerinckii]
MLRTMGIPVGYAFSTIEDTESNKDSGFYPEWDNLPKKIGCLSNLYFQDKYRGLGLGSKMFEMSMEWFESFSDIELIFIYVSNGNDAALKFYLSRGFTFSHEVWNGFIKAVYKFKK